jgi:hypothetical protein
MRSSVSQKSRWVLSPVPVARKGQRIRSNPLPLLLTPRRLTKTIGKQKVRRIPVVPDKEAELSIVFADERSPC